MSAVLDEALALLHALGDPKKTAKLLEELSERTKAANVAEKKAADAKAALDEAGKHHAAQTTARKSELSTAERKHDAAAEELARRIDVNRQQIIEQTRLKEETDRRKVELDKREHTLVEMQRHMANDKASLDRLAKELDERHQKIEARRRKAEEFLKAS